MPHSTDETGEPDPKGPGGGKGAPGHGTDGGKDGEGTGPRNHLDETASDSWAGKFFGQQVRDGLPSRSEPMRLKSRMRYVASPVMW